MAGFLDGRFGAVEQAGHVGLQGKLNIYTCHACHGHVVTKDLDGGVRPFTITC